MKQWYGVITRDYIMRLCHDVLPQELQYALIMCRKINADQTRKDFTEALRQQAVARDEKAKFARDKKLNAAEKQLIGASYLHQQYDLPRCCRTSKQAFDIYNALTTKTAKMKFVKEQIQIRSIGLG